MFCAGVPNGTSTLDECGVCDGDNSSCADCAGTPNGDLENDVFGHCGGGNSLQNAIDLAAEGSTLDIPAGTYTGPFTIDKSLTLQGEDQTTVFVQNADINSNVFSVCLSSQACDVTFDNLTVRNGLYGIRSKSTGVINVTNSTFYHNGYDGETLPDPTADTGQADYAAFWASSHTSNGGAMRIEKATGADISGNTVYNNLRGIRFQDGANGMIYDNVSHDNFESGIYLAASSLGGCVNTHVYNNEVYNNMNNGLLSIGGLGNSFTDNNVTGNWNAGMQMWFASDITVSNNTFTGNNHKSFNGIGNNGDARGGVTYEGAGAYPGATFGCKVLNNTISDNGRDGETTGVYVRDDVSLSSEITGNIFSGQDPDITYGTDTVASGNTCSSGCDCNTGSVADCAGVCDGTAVVDCAGTCGGDSWISDCGCVAADNTGDDCDDCEGAPYGELVNDSFGICDGNGTLQGAIDNAVDGDTINVPSAEYFESILIDKSVTVVCDGVCSIDARGVDGRAVVIDATGATLSGFTIPGDASMYAGVIVTPTCVNVTVQNNTIYGMSQSNPSNDSPLSYGILAYGSSPEQMPMFSNFSNNTIFGVSGSGISLGDFTYGTIISGNSISDIIPVENLGQPFSAGVQAQFSGELSIMDNVFSNLIIGASLPASQGTMIGNTHTNVSSFLTTTSPSQITFTDDVDYWLATTTLVDFGHGTRIIYK